MFTIAHLAVLVMLLIMAGMILNDILRRVKK